MNGRRAKLLRRQQPEDKEPHYNFNFAVKRRQKRAKIALPGYTKPNYEYQREKGDFAGHVTNDYRFQREPVQGYGLSNYVRHQISKAKRAERINNARQSNPSN